MKFKLNQKLYSSLMAMLDDYTAIGVGSMELIDEGGKVIAYIDPNKHLSGVDLSGLDLAGLDLRDADLSDAVLRNADLRHADLSDAVLRHADLRDADLSDAVLSDAVLRNADLRHADLSDAVLRHADLRDADLSDAVLSDAVLRNAVLRNADLSGAVLRNADLIHADLRDADLRHAVLRDADLRHADLSRAQISSANMYGAVLAKSKLGVLPSALTIPQGKLIGFKKIVRKNGSPVIAKIMVKAGTPRSKATTNKMRAKSVVVLGFYEISGERSKETIGYYSMYDSQFEYKLGKVNCVEWERDRWQECAGGIHFFLSWRDAVEYQF